MTKIAPPFVLGLTGSIGMGKSTLLDFLRRARLPVLSADQTVHALLGKKGRAVKDVRALFPSTYVDEAIDRTRLGKIVFTDPLALEKLEAVLHPLVREEEKKFIRRQTLLGRKIIVLEIPLLFETRPETGCDAVLCVTAPLATQRARVLSRPGMTPAQFNAIRRRQLPEAEKKKRADFVLDTSQTRAVTKKQLFEIIEKIIAQIT
jgi:dephospho-CoA kinase